MDGELYTLDPEFARQQNAYDYICKLINEYEDDRKSMFFTYQMGLNKFYTIIGAVDIAYFAKLITQLEFTNLYLRLGL